MKIKLMEQMYKTAKSKDNQNFVLVSFRETFEILFTDEEFSWKADDKLITLILASLRLEDVHNDTHSICNLDMVLQGIYFIHLGKVDVYYKNKKFKFLTHESGSYFGDISYILGSKNWYEFKSKCING